MLPDPNTLNELNAEQLRAWQDCGLVVFGENRLNDDGHADKLAVMRDAVATDPMAASDFYDAVHDAIDRLRTNNALLFAAHEAEQGEAHEAANGPQDRARRFRQQAARLVQYIQQDMPAVVLRESVKHLVRLKP